MIKSKTAFRSLQDFSPPGMRRYLYDVEQFPVLSKETCFALAQKFHQENNQRAGHQLIASHLRLVVKIVRKFHDYWQGNIFDLVQEGNIGLILALQKFDPSRNVQFATYAFYWIHSYIQKYVLNNWRLVKICTARSKRLLFLRIIKEQKFLIDQDQLGCDRLLADRLSLPENEIIDMLQRIHGEDVAYEDYEVSLSYPEHMLLEHNGTTLVEKQAARDTKERVRSVVKKMNGSLSRREQTILEFRLLGNEPISLQKVADMFQLSRERIRQIEKKLLQKLKRAFEKQSTDFSFEQSF